MAKTKSVKKPLKPAAKSAKPMKKTGSAARGKPKAPAKKTAVGTAIARVSKPVKKAVATAKKNVIATVKTGGKKATKLKKKIVAKATDAGPKAAGMMHSIGESLSHAAEVTTRVVATAAGMVAGAMTPNPEPETGGKKRRKGAGTTKREDN